MFLLTPNQAGVGCDGACGFVRGGAFEESGQVPATFNGIVLNDVFSHFFNIQLQFFGQIPE